MNASSLRADDDSAPTLVMIDTLVMDRRPLPPSSRVVPVARATSPLALVPPQPQPQPPALRLVPSPPRDLAPPSHAPAEIETPEATQPARRVRRETTFYRRSTIALALAFAFASGLAASFAVQLSSSASAPPARQPRVAITRSASLRLLDGAESKIEPHAPPGPAHARTRRTGAAAPAPAPASASASAPASAPASASASASASEPDLSPADILDKGLTD